MKIITSGLLDEVTDRAVKSPRLRMNYNFHASLDSKTQRLLNALEPGTVLPIHRHQNTDETYLLLRGSLQIQFYNDSKELIDSSILNPAEGKYGINIPAGQWHTLNVLESGTIIFEVKDGPYQPLEDENILYIDINK
ncbi:MAG: WbuC family cupin fold metalloprotein [Bacteroidota bacterium]|nr:WbuC family cupin fold metalloprotein [Bacteroidota bacterium]